MNETNKESYLLFQFKGEILCNVSPHVSRPVYSPFITRA